MSASVADGAEIGIAIFAACQEILPDRHLEPAADGPTELRGGLRDHGGTRRARGAAPRGGADGCRFEMEPRRAAGGVSEHRRRNQDAGPRAYARIPTGLDRKAVFGARRERWRVRILHAGKRRGARTETPITLEADHPPGANLPDIAEVGSKPGGPVVERLAPCASRAGREPVDRRRASKATRIGNDGGVGCGRAKADTETPIGAGPGWGQRPDRWRLVRAARAPPAAA